MRFLSLLLRDVHMGSHHANCFFLFVAHEKGAREYIHPVSVFMAHFELEVEIVPLTVDVIGQHLPGEFASPFIDQCFPGGEVVRQFVIFVAEHAFPAGGVVDLIVRQVPVIHTIVRPAHGQLEALFTLAQVGLHLFANGDLLAQRAVPVL